MCVFIYIYTYIFDVELLPIRNTCCNFVLIFVLLMKGICKFTPG